MSLPLARHRPATVLPVCAAALARTAPAAAPPEPAACPAGALPYQDPSTRVPDRATVPDTAFDGSLRPGATTSFGSTAEGTAGTPDPHCSGS
ncbi:hypothetical protein ACWEOA_31575 [Streptomyces sp. NPDC004457]